MGSSLSTLPRQPLISKLCSNFSHDSSVGEWMYLTVCPPCGPGHDNSVGEWMNLTVCPPCGPGHDNSVGEWMNLTVCPPCGPGPIPGRGGIFQGIFPGCSHSANPFWTSVAENGSISPQAVDGEEEGRSSTVDRQWLKIFLQLGPLRMVQ